MKNVAIYSPPFYSFLIETLITGRKKIVEKNNMDGALSQCADSGSILQTLWPPDCFCFQWPFSGKRSAEITGCLADFQMHGLRYNMELHDSVQNQSVRVAAGFA